MERFIIFVDGANMTGSLKHLGLRVRAELYADFFRHLFQSALDMWRVATALRSSGNAQLVRVYWYAPGSMDEWGLDDPRTRTVLRDIYESDEEVKRFCRALVQTSPTPTVDPSSTGELAWQLCFKDMQGWYTSRRESLGGLRRFLHWLRNNTDFIEVVECGHWGVDLIHRVLTEKGIDTTLAVDMVSMAPCYDVALVVSGDADYLPPINYVKRHGKQVGVVEFVPREDSDKKGKQFSSKLRGVADFVVRVSAEALTSMNLVEPNR